VRPEGAAVHRDEQGHVYHSGKATGYGTGAHDENGLGASRLVHLISTREGQMEDYSQNRRPWS
jgi:hypothetical protein